MSPGWHLHLSAQVPAQSHPRQLLQAEHKGCRATGTPDQIPLGETLPEGRGPSCSPSHSWILLRAGQPRGLRGTRPVSLLVAPRWPPPKLVFPTWRPPAALGRGPGEPRAAKRAWSGQSRASRPPSGSCWTGRPFRAGRAGRISRGSLSTGALAGRRGSRGPPTQSRGAGQRGQQQVRRGGAGRKGRGASAHPPPPPPPPPPPCWMRASGERCPAPARACSMVGGGGGACEGGAATGLGPPVPAPLLPLFPPSPDWHP